MIKLLIVDDKPFTREGLRECFDWGKYGIEIVGEADDGKTALAEIEKNRPDIVLTDVRMPEMDGLQMSSVIREKYGDMKIIVMSAYSEFEYVKSSIRLDAADYILKPVNLKKLEEVVSKVVRSIGEEREKSGQFSRISTKLLQSLPVLREKFLRTLVSDGVKSREEIDGRIAFLELDMPRDDRYRVVLLSVDDKAAVLENASETDRQLISYGVANIVNELINSMLKGIVFENRTGEYACILHYSARSEGEIKANEEKESLLIGRIKESIADCLSISVTVGIGGAADGLSGIPDSYAQACESASQRLFLGKSRIIRSGPQKRDPAQSAPFNFSYARKVTDLMLMDTDGTRLGAAVDGFFAELERHRRADMRFCLNICYQLILMAFRQLSESDIRVYDRSFDEEKIREDLFRLETLGEMKEFIKKFFIKINSDVSKKRLSKSQRKVEKIKSIVQNRFTENINVAEIAEEVSLSVPYLCMVFKQETGETINDYITRLRVRKAKELLKNPDIKLCDICNEIGYSDPGYFSKIFRRSTNLSPSEYRRNVTELSM